MARVIPRLANRAMNGVGNRASCCNVCGKVEVMGLVGWTRVQLPEVAVRPCARETRPRRKAAWAVIALALAGITMMSLLACAPGQSGTATLAGPTPTPLPPVVCPPADAVAGYHLVHSGQLIIASDTTYLPAEFVNPSRPSELDGYDMDLARELARRLCLKPQITQATGDSILDGLSSPPLGQQPWDLAISSIPMTRANLKLVDMLPYLVSGEEALVRSGNPGAVHSLADLCGKTVAVQNGTLEQLELANANGTGPSASGRAPVCQSRPITVVSRDYTQDVVAQVQGGHAAAALLDQPVAAYYIALHPSQLAQGYVTPGSATPVGVALRKDNPHLEAAIRQALQDMLADGTYASIMGKWGQQDLACLPHCPPPSA
jgi:polar amino acid transport system substrate-binding protein